MEQIQKWFWGGRQGTLWAAGSQPCWKWVLNSVWTNLPLEAKCPRLRSDLPPSFTLAPLLVNPVPQITHITVTENCWGSTVHPLPSASKRMSKLLERTMSQILQPPHHTKEITLHDFTLTYSSSWNLNCRTRHPNCPAQVGQAFGHTICCFCFETLLQLEPS